MKDYGKNIKQMTHGRHSLLRDKNTVACKGKQNWNHGRKIFLNVEIMQKLYNLIITITDSEKENLMPPSTSNQDLAEEFITSLPKLKKFMII